MKLPAWIALAVLAVAGFAMVTALAAGAKPKPPLSQEQAERGGSYASRAIKAEQRAINALDDHKILTGSKEARLGTVYINESFIVLENHNDGDDGTAQNFAGAAHTLDESADKDLDKAQTAKGPEQDALIKDAMKKLAKAIQFKDKVEIFFVNYSPPETESTTTTSEPAPGPLTACVFITNNGSTSTENVHVRDPNGGGMTGTVTFNGQGLNQTNPITLDPSGSAITPFTVGTFGTASIGVTVGPQTASTTFTLDSGNDTTTTDCQ